MIEKAIANARAHNINVHTVSKTAGDGNCIFESVLNNINLRESFLESYDGTADHWRNVWMTEVEGRAYANWNCGLSEEEWLEEFHRLKSSRIYECMLGDLILLGVAHCIQKDILIFNTSTLAHSPIYVIQSSKLCGQLPNSEIPICLAYNQVHYESLIPTTSQDVEKTVSLKNQWLQGNYQKTFNDIPFFRLKSSKSSYAQVVKKNVNKCTNSSDCQSKLDKVKPTVKKTVCLSHSEKEPAKIVDQEAKELQHNRKGINTSCINKGWQENPKFKLKQGKNRTGKEWLN